MCFTKSHQNRTDFEIDLRGTTLMHTCTIEVYLDIIMLYAVGDNQDAKDIPFKSMKFADKVEG
ncbi:MAG: hypothetical protein RLZZ28_1902, partial [Bacteroidota bacterium]